MIKSGNWCSIISFVPVNSRKTIMTERLLQYIWQFQYFSKQDLILHTGVHFQVIHPGILNTNQGPDFLEGKIKTENTIWAGPIEVHIKASDWYKHAHQHDPNYGNVILHVVWENDLQNQSADIPVFCLHERVHKLLLDQYSYWMKSRSFIPCGRQVRQVKDIVWISWKERLLIERLQRKTISIIACLQQTRHHWEEVFWRMLSRSFGIKINAEAFEAIAGSLPVRLLAKHKNQLHQLEALLLGQAGLLRDEPVDEYPKKLYKEYHFYAKKYGLQSIREQVHFLRMRPSGFPTVRLAQLAMLVHTSNHLFPVIREIQHIDELKKLLSVTASDYWNKHYTLESASSSKPKKLGFRAIDNIIINAIVPVLFAYGHFNQSPQYVYKALEWLKSIDAEENSVIDELTQLGVKNKNACDSQALIELKTNYCDNKKCLDCAIGYALLKQAG